MRDLLFTPLGLTHTVTLPEDAILYGRSRPRRRRRRADRLAHVGPPAFARPGGPDHRSRRRRTRLRSPAHDRRPRAPTAPASVSEESVLAMQQLHADVPDKYSLGDSWGLGWIRFGWNGDRLFGHDGNTIGQAAFLRSAGERPRGHPSHQRWQRAGPVRGSLPRDLRGAVGSHDAVTAQPPAEPAEVDVTPFLGTYERARASAGDSHEDDGPLLRTTMTGPLVEMTPEPAVEYPMVPVDENCSPCAHRARRPGRCHLLLAAHRRGYLHFGARATRRRRAPRRVCVPTSPPPRR